MSLKSPLGKSIKYVCMYVCFLWPLSLWSGNQRFWSNQTIKNFITDHLKWTLHMWEGAGKHLRLKHNGLKNHPLWQRLLLGGGASLVLINEHCSVNKNSYVLLKIYMVEFEMWLVSRRMHQVLAQAFKLIKSSNVEKFVQCMYSFIHSVELKIV